MSMDVALGRELYYMDMNVNFEQDEDNKKGDDNSLATDFSKKCLPNSKSAQDVAQSNVLS